MALFIDYKFYVIRFLEPSSYLENFEYVYVPRSWIKIRRPKANKVFVLVAYPSEHPYKTIERVNKEEHFDLHWENYWATVEYTTDDKDDAVWWLATLGRIKPQVHSTLGLPTDPFHRIILMASNKTPEKNINLKKELIDTKYLECKPLDLHNRTNQNPNSYTSSLETSKVKIEHGVSENTSIQLFAQKYENEEEIRDMTNAKDSEYSILVEKGPLTKIIITRSNETESLAKEDYLNSFSKSSYTGQSSANVQNFQDDLDASKLILKSATKEVPSVFDNDQKIHHQYKPITDLEKQSYQSDQIQKHSNKTSTNPLTYDRESRLTRKLRYFRKSTNSDIQKPYQQHLKKQLQPTIYNKIDFKKTQSTQYPEEHTKFIGKTCFHELKHPHTDFITQNISEDTHNRQFSLEVNRSTFDKINDQTVEKVVNCPLNLSTQSIDEKPFNKIYRRHSCQEVTDWGSQSNPTQISHPYRGHLCQGLNRCVLLSNRMHHEVQLELPCKKLLCEDIHTRFDHYGKCRRNYICCQTEHIDCSYCQLCMCSRLSRDRERPLCRCCLPFSTHMLDPYGLRAS